MKRISFFAEIPFSLSTNEMKHLKGGGQCGYLPEGQGGVRVAALCGLSEGQAMARVQYNGGSWCCYDCSTRTNGLETCR